MNNLKNLEELLSLPKDQTILEQKVSPLTAPGENYGSVMLSVVITVQTPKETKEIHTVAKTVPPSEFVQKIFETPVSFRNEIEFYKSIVPLLRDFQRSHGVKKVIDFTPEFLGSRLNLNGSEIVDNDGVLLLENLKVKKYATLDRIEGVDLESAKLVLADLARLHAVPLALKTQKPEVFKKEVLPFLRASKLDDHADHFLENTLKLIDSIDEIKNMKSRVLECYNRVFTKREPEELFATIVHDDCWTNNTMLRFEDGSPVSNKLVDFQGCIYDSPGRDLVFFLFSSVKSTVIQQHYHDLIKHYHEIFVATLQDLLCDTSAYTLKALEKEIEEEAKNSQLPHIMFMLYPIYMPKENVKDLEIKPGKKMPEASDLHKQRLVFVVNEFAKKNWI